MCDHNTYQSILSFSSMPILFNNESLLFCLSFSIFFLQIVLCSICSAYRNETDRQIKQFFIATAKNIISANIWYAKFREAEKKQDKTKVFLHKKRSKRKRGRENKKTHKQCEKEPNKTVRLVDLCRAIKIFPSFFCAIFAVLDVYDVFASVSFFGSVRLAAFGSPFTFIIRQLNDKSLMNLH